MGRLRLRFAEHIDAGEQARILAGLRKLNAKLRVRPLRRGDSSEEWIFDTMPLPLPKPRKPPRSRLVSDRQVLKRYRAQMLSAMMRCTSSSWGGWAEWHDAVAGWNDDPWTWERLTRARELAAAVAIAQGCGSAALAPFPAQTKGAGMPNSPEWQDYDRDLRELYEVAADLVAGRGGPEEYRARQSDPRLLMPAFGKTPLIVGVWEEPYGPLTAMCVAGFILYGQRFEEKFTRAGITGDLVDAYDLLERHYGPRVPCLDAPKASTPSLAAALEAPRQSEGFLKLTVKKAAPPLAAPPSRPALAGSPSRPALPDLGGRS